jgi:hypothetical protein
VPFNPELAPNQGKAPTSSISAHRQAGSLSYIAPWNVERWFECT